ncbi:phage tail assembly chaperone [Sphingomonas sp. MMS24-JH45]
MRVSHGDLFGWNPASAGERDFAATAARLAGLAGVMFGWRPDEFWRATPDELAALMRALVPEEAAPPDGATIARLQEAYPDG